MEIGEFWKRFDALFDKMPWVAAIIMSLALEHLSVSAAVIRVLPVSTMSSIMMHFLSLTPDTLLGRLIWLEFLWLRDLGK